MNDLLRTYTFLATRLQGDPQLSLASVVAWLDPLWQDADEDWDNPYTEEETLSIALCITRKAFPDIYIQAVEAIRQGASYADLDRLICERITAYGIPLDNLEWIGYGIPIPAYGATLDDPEFYTIHPEVIPILACFGISPEPTPYHITIPDCVYTAGDYIATDLEKHPDKDYQQISWMMKWLFSCSGNSAIDLDYETMSEFQPLTWDKHDLAFAIQIIEEANTVMSDVLTGMAIINQQPKLLDTLRDNIQRIYQALKKQKVVDETLTIRLRW